MTTEKYFAELTRVLAQKGIRVAPQERGGLPILLDGHPPAILSPLAEPSSSLTIFAQRRPTIYAIGSYPSHGQSGST